MSEPVKISSLEIEAVKRVNAVALQPSKDGLTVIGGANNQGKTSVIDAIAWALGGDRLKPDRPRNQDSVRDPYMKVELSNGIVVERKGKNSALKVSDPSGEKGGQQLLNTFVEALALDLPKFMEGSDREKADALLDVIGLKDELEAFDRRIDQLYNKRTAIGQIEQQKRGAAADMPSYPEAPEEPVSASELIRRQQEILARNGENQRKREQVSALEGALHIGREEKRTLQARIEDLERQLAEARERSANVDAALERTSADLEAARKTAEQLHDESTAEIEASIAEIDAVNEMVRTNAAKAKAKAEADEYAEQYQALTAEIEEERAARTKLLTGADLPLPGLTADNGVLAYEGMTWGDMSGSDQLKVATAIVRAIKPECGFVLVDKLEQMDLQTLEDFGRWAEAQGLQIIGTRVSSGDECSIVIQDGYAIERDGAPVEVPKAKPAPERKEVKTETREWSI